MAVYHRRGDTLFPEFTDSEAFLEFLSVEIPVGQGLTGWVAENGKAIINGNPAVEPGYLAIHRGLSRSGRRWRFRYSIRKASPA